MPLVILLHAYRTDGDFVHYYFQLQPLADRFGFLYVHPDGSEDSAGDEFWNATEACCDVHGSGVDDSGYLEGLIRDIEAVYSVDPKRVYIVGHSNGGFMAYRMACDHADTVAAIVSVAGAMFKDPSACKPSHPVSVLEVHGTADDVIPYRGGRFQGAPVPGAEQSVLDWARFDGCARPPTAGPHLDVAAINQSQSTPLPGKETRVSIYRKGCRAGTEIQLWTVVGGDHIPEFSKEFAHDLIKFLFAHPKT
jgi:polyhydroxybutyrate depolymerase